MRRGVVVIASTHKERIVGNLDVFDFSLSEKDMTANAGLDENKRLCVNLEDLEFLCLAVSPDLPIVEVTVGRCCQIG